MPETALSLTYDELQKQVAQYAYGTRNLKSLNQDDIEQLKATINGGLRRFYYPAQLGPEFLHDWSFLVAGFDFLTEVGTDDYLMPFNFGGAIGPLHHDPNDNIKISMQKVTPNQILSHRQQNMTITNWPTLYAEMAVPQGGVNGLRWKIMVWPSPSAEYHLFGRMRVLPLGPNGIQDMLYGGPEHSQTIIESCKAQAELDLDGTPGPHFAEFKQCLLTSIMLDGSMHAPEKLGYNGNSSYVGSALMRPDGGYFENFSNITYGGSSYTS